jgi:hypothetical protein
MTYDENIIFKIILMGFIILFSYMCKKYSIHIQPPIYPLLSPYHLPLLQRKEGEERRELEERTGEKKTVLEGIA